MPNPKTFRRVLALQGADTKQSEVPAEIEMLVEGSWNTPYHGRFDITKADLAEYKQHFDDEVRKGVPIDLEHDTIGGAVGWIEQVEIKPSSTDPNLDALWATQIAWTPKGEQLIKDREYRFFSPEFADEDYEDPEQAGVFLNNVLIGGGLTNRPLFKNLTPVAASDGTKNDAKNLTGENKHNIIYLSGDERNMNLQELLAKDAADLTAEEKAFIVENKADLTDEQVTSLTEAGVLEADTEEEEQPGGGENEEEEEQPAAGDQEEEEEEQPAETPEAKEAREAAEKAGLKVVSAKELKALKGDAAAGRQAAEKLLRAEHDEHINSLLFSEKAPKMPITAKEKVQGFYHKLNDALRKEFDEIAGTMPSLAVMFAKQGGEGGSADGDVADEVKEKALAEQKQASDDGKAISYGTAVKRVLASDKALAERYNQSRNEGK